VKGILVLAAAVICLGVFGQAAGAQDTGTPSPAPAPNTAPAPTPAPAQDASMASTGVNGKWHFVLETPGGDREADSELTVDADGKVTGTFGKSAVTGTFKDGQLDLAFQFTSDELGETSPLKISGKLDESSALAGTWEFSTYNGTFKATRPKAV
jgi:hypothetical protein